jgi:hypothetical protein
VVVGAWALAITAAAVAGVVPGQLTVTVHGQWRLTRAGLEPVPHVDQRTLDRSRRNAGSVGPGEEAVVICHGATMIGRLADFQDPLDHGVGVSKQRRS